MQVEEVWATLPQYPNYQVSNQGNVRSIKSNRLIKYYPNKKKNGYARICLYDENNVRKMVYIHRLVCEMFVENPDGLDTVDHLNFCTTDNRAENLRWLSRSDNSRNKQKKMVA